MFRRRRGLDAEDADETPDDETADPAVAAVEEEAAAETDEAGSPDRTYGPFDVTEVDLEDEELAKGRMDLGALIVRLRQDLRARIEVDQQSQRIRAVTLLADRSGVQLQAFAAPRSSGIWSEVSREIAADATKKGGTATALEGPYGPELKVAVPATMPDGTRATQTTRVVGIDGPRWLLRATFFGPAVERSAAGVLDDVLRDTIVVRGVEPMAPRDPLPLRMPTTDDEDDDDATDGDDAVGSSDDD